MLKLIPVLLTAIACTACAPVRITPPDVELMGIEVQDVSITHINFNATLRIYNPNREVVEVGAMSYELELNGQKIFASTTYVNEAIPPMSSIIVPLRISSAFWNLLSMFSKIEGGSKVEFRLSGDIEAGPEHNRKASFAFERTGAIDLGKKARSSPGIRPNVSPRSLPRSPSASGDYI